MTQKLKLRDADREVREFFNARATSGEECIIQDDDDQPIAAIIPAQEYEIYQQYLRRREENFAVIDRIRDKMKDYDPDEIQANIDKAVEEVKAKSRPPQKTT